ncbi:MAG: hypothetical protein ACRCX2_12455 [Paraclostridium sp.]
MNFSYTNVIEDYIEANKIIRAINPRYKFFIIFLPLFIFSLLGVILFFDIKSNGGNFAQLLCIILTNLIVILYYCFCLPKRIDKSQAKKIRSNEKINKNILIERKLTLTEEKLLISIKDESVELRLKDVSHVLECNDKLFIITKIKSIISVIPITIFTSSLEKSEFIKKVTINSKN